MFAYIDASPVNKDAFVDSHDQELIYSYWYMYV
jgi:hypothetical protein